MASISRLFFPLVLTAAFSAQTLLHAQIGPNGATASFRGSLPPKPTSAPSPEALLSLESEWKAAQQAFQAVKKHPRAADADIFLKAVRYALDFQEWYDKKPEDSLKKAKALLTEASQRISLLAKNETPWLTGSGLKVVGFYSDIDGSPQPYGVEIPEGLSWGPNQKKAPLWIWLHGRGDTATDLNFVYGRLMAKKRGEFQPSNAIVVHPFGRYCNGWKSAGETDVFECRDDAQARFHTDPNRVVLAGFSMGGAGAWHMGAHFADQWACVHTGAGFADVKRYLKLTPEKYPVSYEQKLWGVYDVPDYARNFFNVPLISYSGELDAQRDSAEYMMEVLGKEGLRPPHLIGPQMPHKYHPETAKEVQIWIEKTVDKGRDPTPSKVILQSRAARYSTMAWLEVLQCQTEWDEIRLEAEKTGNNSLQISTRNVQAFRIDTKQVPLAGQNLTIDGTKINLGDQPNGTFVRQNKTWQVAASADLSKALSGPTKAGGTCIEDAFLHRFVIVLPDPKASSGNEAVDTWVQNESQHFIQRWRSLMRGDPVVMTGSEYLAHPSPHHLTGPNGSLILWGTPESNPLVAKLFDASSPLTAQRFPGTWSKTTVSMGKATADSKQHILVASYPKGLTSPRHFGGHVVLNSGLTFREAHDRTNSLQNPKLPDWAILDISTPPSAESAGKVVAADFFDERWQVR